MINPRINLEKRKVSSALDNRTTIVIAIYLFVIAATYNILKKEAVYAQNNTSKTANTVISEILPNEETGFIEGNVVYPSDGNPSDTKIYVENISTAKTYMVHLTKINDPSIFTDKKAYKIQVPVGSHYVYAMTSLVKGREDYKAFYSDFVTCGLNVQCESHEPIIVTVAAGKSSK